MGLSTIVDYERERRAVSDSAIESIRAALEAAGVIFVAENGDGPGVRLRKTGAEEIAATALRKAGTAIQAPKGANPGAIRAKGAAARGKAEATVDKALAGVAATPMEKARRKRKVTRVAKDLKPRGRTPSPRAK